MSFASEISSDRRLKGLARKFLRRTEGTDFLTSEIAVPVKSDEWPVIAKLGQLLGVASRQDGKKAVFAIPPERRNPSAWAYLREVFAKTPPSSYDIDETFRRARLLVRKDIVDAMQSDDFVVRFVRRGDDMALEFLRMLEWTVKRIGSNGVGEVTTLSQVGSNIFGDSKSLRSGLRRTIFERIASAVVGLDSEDGARDALAHLGIEENPFTSSVTVFAPFAFSLEADEECDYPERMFKAGLAVQLPRQTIMRIRAIRLADGFGRIMTSENAAPFEQMVRARIPCLYTEGYPNATVLRLLKLLAEQGVSADHYGDGDLDGFLIADRIKIAIPVRRVVADEVADSSSVSRRPVSVNMRDRWEAYLSAHKDFSHLHALRLAIERGWTEQESYGNICLNAKTGDVFAEGNAKG